MVLDGVVQKYAVAGAIAALYYLETTFTEDVDILISFDDLQGQSATTKLEPFEPLVAYLRKHGYTEFKAEGVVIDGWPVQFLPVADALDAEGLERAVEIEI